MRRTTDHAHDKEKRPYPPWVGYSALGQELDAGAVDGEYLARRYHTGGTGVQTSVPLSLLSTRGRWRGHKRSVGGTDS